jgi:hypothetical protein
VSTRQSAPRGKDLEQFARRQRSAAGGVEITLDPGEEEANGRLAWRVVSGQWN